MKKIKKLIRISDGQPFILNGDGKTYTMKGQKQDMPTTYFRYTYDRLMSTGAFKEG